MRVEPSGKLVFAACPCCTFGHDQAPAAQEHADLCAEEAHLLSDTSAAGKARYSAWRMDHAKTHFNVQPAKHGLPMLMHHLDDQILDLLHPALLGLPKIPWKHAILNNASDDARALISSQLKEWRHPLDTRRKDNNRVRAQKWYTGEAWSSFCQGLRGSPGGPQAIAQIVLIIANDLTSRVGSILAPREARL